MPVAEPKGDARFMVSVSAPAMRIEAPHPPPQAATGAPAASAEGGQQADAVPMDSASAGVDAAEWNSVLVWARQQRGPQWDTGTGVCVR